MQINKKVLSIAITALLLFSVLAAAVPAFAFDATSVINLSATSGAVGSVVTVSGPGVGFPAGANPFGSVKVYYDNLGTLLNGTTFAAADGSFSARIRIPAGTQGTHYVIVQDSIGTQASAVFTVTPTLSASATRALPGDSLTLTGNGYAANSAVTINFASTTLATPVSITLTTPTVTTDANGTFTAVVIVPATITIAQFDTYTITATDAAANTATRSVIINYYISANPSSAPPGVTTTISGRIPPNTAYIISIDTVTIFTGTSDATGRFTHTYVIPALIAVGAHTLTVNWAVVNSASNTLTVTVPPTVALSAASGIPGAVITVTGAGYVARANVTLTFGTTVVNSTATDSRFGPTDAAGAFSAEFSVPNLTPGAYIVTVTDQFGASASVVGGFLINAAPVTRVTTASTFRQGDMIFFDINSTDPAVTSVAVMIKDSAGTYWWGTPDLAITWPVVFDAQGRGFTPFALQLAYGLDNMHLVLPANAPLGAWNWTITLPPASTSLPLVRSGLFLVQPAGSSAMLDSMNATLNAMNATINQINTRVLAINGTVATIQTATGTITTSLTALDAKVTGISGSMATLSTNIGQVQTSVQSLSGSISSISNGIATIQTSLGEVKTSLSNIDPVIGLIAGDTTILKTSLGEVTTSLSSIGTKVTSIDGNVATVKTDLGTLQGTVTSVSGNVATIQTALGPMQADITGLKTAVADAQTATNNLSPLIIVAIVLALIAAIAAIASIVLMRRKIAG